MTQGLAMEPRPPVVAPRPELEWMSRKEAARYLTRHGFTMSHRTLANLASNNNAGKGPPFERMRWSRVRYLRAELDLWMAQEVVKVR